MAIEPARVRKLFPGTKRQNYLFNGGTCLTSTPSRNAVEEFLSEVENGFTEENWRKWTERSSTAYRLFAELIGAREDEVVAIPNTTVGTGMMASMVDPKKESNVVMDDLEYQTAFPFTVRERRGVEIRVAKSSKGYSDVEKLLSLIDDRTAAVFLSAVSCWNGYRYDLRPVSEAAHRHGAYMAVDGAQQVGAVRLDVKKAGVDFLATCGHKWLLAPPGTGFFYIRRELAGRFDPVFPGWLSLTAESSDDVWHPVYPDTAARFESGMKNFMLISASKATLELIHSLGPESIEREILKRTAYLLEKLRDMRVEVYTPVEEELHAGLVTFLLKNHGALFEDLMRRSIVAYHHPENVVRNLRWPHGGLRIDPTFFNTYEEIDQLLGLVRKHS